VAPKPITPLLIALARARGLDPRAVIAVARGEGGLVNRPGQEDIGDLAGGGSYGPFQLYARGALPARYRGNQQLADSWAWSPQGVGYALDQMLKAGAGGKKGASAVEHIIRRFERPANPDKSVRLALGRLGTSQVAGGVESGSVGGSRIPPSASFRPPVEAGPSRKKILLQALLDDNLLGAIPQLRAAGRAGSSIDPINRAAGMTNPTPAAQPLMPGGANAKPFNLEELFLGKNAFKRVNGKLIPVGAVPGHDDHLHAAFSDPNSTLRAIAIAKKYGLSVRENPYTDPVDPVHTKNSWHYQRFPGRHNGRELGRAVDVSGNPQALSKYYHALRR
jgi:hypothetical protein